MQNDRSVVDADEAPEGLKAVLWFSGDDCAKCVYVDDDRGCTEAPCYAKVREDRQNVYFVPADSLKK